MKQLPQRLPPQILATQRQRQRQWQQSPLQRKQPHQLNLQLLMQSC